MNRSGLHIALFQAPLSWEDPKANRAYFTEKIQALPGDIQLAVFPEMFTTGFTMNARALAEEMDGPTVTWMKSLAAETGIALTGSIIIREKDRFYNRLLFVFPDGRVEHYDKRHLFSLGGEDEVYTPGTRRLVVELGGWKICPLICYDLRFPVWSRNTDGYDLSLYVTSWPKVRIKAWDVLLQARAVENMAFCAGVNRIGKDGNGVPHVGHSVIYDPLGETLAYGDEQETVLTVRLDKGLLEKTRKKLRFLDDRDDFVLEG